MPAKAKSKSVENDIGNPVSQSKNNAVKFSQFNKSNPLPTPIVDKGEDRFDLSNLQQNVIPFDIKTGIESRSPEILLFSEFSPAYEDSLKLSPLGNLAENKQNAILVSAKSSVESILDSNLFNDIDAELINNKKNIFDFCTKYTNRVSRILGMINNIKNLFDCRYPPDEETLKVLGVENIGDYGHPMSIEEFLLEDLELISKWSSTKTWIQCCLQLKDLLRNGSVDGFLTDFIPNHSTTNSSGYNSPYHYFSPKTVNSKRFGFKQNQTLVVNAFANNNQRSNRSNSRTIPSSASALAPINILIDSISSVYNNGFLTNTLNTKNELIQDSIAKLAYVISNEYQYSTKIRDFSAYGYTAKNGKNFEMWDYLIGQVGSDITDFDTNPLGEGNSLINIAQSIGVDNSEVLTFEDRYIVDNVGTARNAVLTPGTYYYLESTLNTDSNTFDFSRLDTLLQKLKHADGMLNSVSSMFDARSIVPYLNVSNKLGLEQRGFLSNPGNNFSLGISLAQDANVKQLPSGYLDIATSQDFLSNPIYLLREIEKRILSNSALLDRNKVNLIGQTIVSPELGQTIDDVPKLDVSWLLINLSSEHLHLRTLLFCYLLSSNSSERKVELVGKIISFIRNKATKYPSGVDPDNGSPETDVSARITTISEIEAALLGTGNETSTFVTIKLLNDIASFIKEIEQLASGNSNSDLEITKKQKLQPLPGKSIERNLLVSDDSLGQNLSNSAENNKFYDNKVTFYSGLQRTTYCLAIFELCCLMAQSLTSEKLLFVEGKPAYKTVTTETIQGKQYEKYVGEGPFGYWTTDYYEDIVTKSVTVPAVEESIAVAKIGDSNSNYKNSSYPQVVFYKYDEMMVDIENQLYEINKGMFSRVNTMKIFVSTLKTSLENFKSMLTNSDFSLFLNSTRSILQDPAITNLLMTQEQLTLVNSRLFDVANRSSENYETPIKKIVPYFSSLSDNLDVEKIIPIEDVGLVSWDLILKHHLKHPSFTSGQGFNKKIISVGLPQKLYRSLMMDGSSLGNSTVKNGIVRIKIYRIDSLRPDLIHRPIDFLFDLRVFPTRNLANFPNAEKIINGTQEFDYDRIPYIVANKNLDNFNIIDGFDSRALSARYSFLSAGERRSIYENHTNSFIFEQYFSFLSDNKIDENRYTNFSLLQEQINNQFEIFVNQLATQGGQSPPTLNPSANNFFLRDTYLVPSLDAVYRELISPRKFDRVFHMVIDPDDFLIDTNASDDSLATSASSLERYKNKIQLVDSSNPSSGYKRSQSEKNEISFDNYFAAVESFENDTNNSV